MGPESQVVYVWIDALLNYYSALSYAREGEDLTDRFWPATLHLIGKDILKFHAVIWPALLMAADIEVPRQRWHPRLPADGRAQDVQVARQRASSRSQVIDLYGADALRYYALREVRFGQDGEVSPEGFETRYNTELANEYGNLASRTLAMIGRYRDGVVPEAEPTRRWPATSRAWRRRVSRPDRPGGAVARARRDLAARQAAQPLRAGRGAVAALEGRGAQAERLDQVLYSLAEGLRVVSVLLLAFMPDVRGAPARRARQRGHVARERALRGAARRARPPSRELRATLLPARLRGPPRPTEPL